MATKYTYSFNCIIKYRFPGESNDTSTPKFSDSSSLYSCESEITPEALTAQTTTLSLPLPGYIAGDGTEIKWYLNNTYSTAAVAGQALTTKDWTITQDMAAGTFVSYTATIILYSNSSQTTYTWNYKTQTTETTVEDTSSTTQCWVSENPLYSAPQIPAIVKVQSGNSVTIYTFQTWEGPADNTYTAKYNTATYSSTNPFMTNLKDIFTGAEPYHYGTGFPEDGMFIPIGEDEDPNTLNDIKVQAPEINGYSNIKTIDGFKIKNRALQYVEKGTFPLPHLLASFQCTYAGGFTENPDHDRKASVACHFDENGQLIRILISSNMQGDENVTLTPDHPRWKERGHPGKLPTRLGFVLTGGGGGSGGMSRIDPKSDTKDNDYTTPGGGGGGGEIVCGVLDLTPTAASTAAYVFHVGGGGRQGAHYEGNPDYNNPKYGKDGKDGEDSIIKKNGETLYIVGGGKGGKAGGHASGGEGGAGGDAAKQYVLYQNNQGCTLCQRYTGGKGGGPVGESGTEVQNASLFMNLYFSKTPPSFDSEGKNKFYVPYEHESISRAYTKSDNFEEVDVPGGHSLGEGGTKDDHPDSGAGGRGGYLWGRDGGGGFIGFYY